jgi:hypothetical protein
MIRRRQPGCPRRPGQNDRTEQYDGLVQVYHKGQIGKMSNKLTLKFLFEADIDAIEGRPDNFNHNTLISNCLF